MRILGIDPMDFGALAWLDEENKGLVCVDMPVVKVSKTRVEVDVDGLYQMIRQSRAQKAYVEKMQPMPKGGNANFKRGGYSYLLRGLLHAAGLSLVEVAPKEWQKTFGIRTSKDDDTKMQSYLIASRMFPTAEFKTERGRILDGRCDAALIAEYGRKVETGNGSK